MPTKRGASKKSPENQTAFGAHKEDSPGKGQPIIVSTSDDRFFTFFHPDYTVGPGVPPGQPLLMRGSWAFTTGRELRRMLVPRTLPRRY